VNTQVSRLALAVAAALIVAPVAPACAQAAKSRPAAAAASIAVPDIPFETFRLKNGLTVIVHEDRKAPIVAVNVWYHVGSKNEPDGKSGFAHLFEHLMFNGSENLNEDWFKKAEAIGATDLNGTTNQDRTNYFQNVPTAALDTILWMESDRMGHLLGAIDQARLDEQRGVVQNEKRQGENQPYGRVWNAVTDVMYPDDHPYGHTVIGEMEDLNAASLDDVRDWFRTYYGPNNAVIVLAGDIDAGTAREKVERFFGHIPPGPPVQKATAWIPSLPNDARMVQQDRVPQARFHRFWHVPQNGAKQTEQLSLLAAVLGQGKTSRLYERLVYKDQIATDVAAFAFGSEISGLFGVQVTARPGDDLTAVETAVEEEIARLLASGPTAAEVNRVRTQTLAGLVRGVERIGGFGGKSDLLAESQVYFGRPDAWKEAVRTVQTAKAADLQAAGNAWLKKPSFTLEVVPFPTDLAAVGPGVDRKSGPPQPGDMKAPAFPAVERATLSNGMKVVLARRTGVPVVNLNMVFDAGFAADSLGKPGTTSLAMNMLDEGTRTRDALQISRELADLGAAIGTGAGLDTSSVSLSALKANLGPSLDLYADVILNPSFPQTDFERLKRLQIAGIQREKNTPQAMAFRVLPALLYGQGHAYAVPFSGSGTEDAVAALTVEDMRRYHQTWLKPNNATLVVTGDVALEELTPELEKRFGGWAQGEVPAKNVAPLQPAQRQTVYLIDRPGAVQSVIAAAVIAPPKSNPDEVGVETLNTVLGGQFTSRINMNLREAKGWSYGAGSFVRDSKGPRLFVAYAPVQTDKTKESIVEIRKELADIVGPRPVTADELAAAQSNLTQSLPGQWETNGGVAASLVEQIVYGLPDDYWNTYAQRVKAVGAADLQRAGSALVRHEGLTWVIVGDRSKIEAGVRELGLADVRVIDADGNPVR
jgi:zinc protease